MSSDLDLDELHQQVSKLMDQASKPKAKKAHIKSADKVEAPKEAPKEEPKPEPKVETKAEEPKREESTSIAVSVRRPPVAQIVPRRKGVAMDIVQPSKPGLEPPSVRASRTSATLQPTGHVEPEPPRPRETTTVTEPPKHDDVSEETLASLNLQADAPRKTVEPDPEHKSAFPDPLDVHGFTGEEDKKPEPTPAPTMQAEEKPDTPAEAPADHEKEEAPVEPAPAAAPAEAGTPFVNAKVEKRPLGAFANNTEPEAPAEPASAETVEVAPEESKDGQPKEEKLADAAVTVPPPPKELNPELVAIESSEPEFTPVVPPPPPAADKPTTVNDLRQMSIPHQYKESDVESSKDDRPIFDTKTYHPPIAPVAKAHKGGGSKAGMMLTLILIILMVVAGVVAYYVATGGVDLERLF
jgi:hypothetical protein